MPNVSHEPHDTKGFGHVLWNILGGKNAKMREAAQQLSTHHSRLSDIIHGRQKISYASLSQKKWPEVLQQHYPEAWQKHGLAFQELIEKTKEVSAPKRGAKYLKSSMPLKQDDLGVFIWKIIGGAEAHITKSAKLLSMAPKRFSDIIHGRRKISQKAVAEKKWRDVFAEHYPEAWQKHRDEFEHALTTQLCRNRIPIKDIEADKTQTLRNEWRKAVGQFLGETCPQSPTEMNEATFSKMKAGDPEKPIALYRALLVEVFLRERGDLHGRESITYMKAQKLLDARI